MTSLCAVVGEDVEAVIDGEPVLIRHDSCTVHHPDCERGDDCRCPPALAVPGSLVCGWHADITRERLRELPELWAILGARPSGTGPRGSGEPPQPISDHARHARTAMRIMLVTWCKILAEDRGSPLPDERVIAARTRAEVARRHADRDIAYRAARDPLLDRPARARALDEATKAAGRAERAGELRESDADIVEALREHIDRHLHWLLNGEYADQLVHDVAGVYATARHIAHPPPAAAVRILCSCGRRVAASTDRDAVMMCPGCGERGPLKWWQAREAPAPGPLLTLLELPDWLLIHQQLAVTHEQLRNWTRAERGPRMIPVEESYRDDRGVLRGATYDPVAVAAIAHHRLGKRATA